MWLAGQRHFALDNSVSSPRHFKMFYFTRLKKLQHEKLFNKGALDTHEG